MRCFCGLQILSHSGNESPLEAQKNTVQTIVWTALDNFFSQLSLGTEGD